MNDKIKDTFVEKKHTLYLIKSLKVPFLPSSGFPLCSKQAQAVSLDEKRGVPWCVCIIKQLIVKICRTQFVFLDVQEKLNTPPM